MLIHLAHNKGSLASCLIVDTDDHRCGLCFGREDSIPIEPEHDYRHHTQVRLPAETYDLITDRTVFWNDGHYWMDGLEVVVKVLEAAGVEVLAARRRRPLPIEHSDDTKGA